MSTAKHLIHIGRASLLALAGSALLALSLTGAASADTPAAADKSVTDTEAAFAVRFPETEPSSIVCEGFGPLCQVVAGKTVFYVDREARHAFIGRLYDLDAKRDLTEAALQAMTAETGEAIKPPPAQPRAIEWKNLPFDAAVVRNPGGVLEVAVFSDLNCGYCRNLSAALDKAPDIEAHEFLIGIAGSDAVSRAIGCAPDPEGAIKAYYESGAVPTSDCDRDIVGPAREAARALGRQMQGTPTFVRPDGAITSGFRDIESLRAWLEAGADTIEGGTQ